MSEKVSDILRDLGGSGALDITDDRQSAAVYELLPGYLNSKGLDTEAIEGLAKRGKILGAVLDGLLLGNNFQGIPHKRDMRRQAYFNDTVSQSYSALREKQWTAGEYRLKHPVYTGTPKDNASITGVFTGERGRTYYDDSPSRQREFRRNGASRKLLRSDVHLEQAQRAERLTNIPIAIVGAGASGILAGGYLQDMGFSNITIFDKRGRINGIWAQDNVREGSKNNPFDIHFLGKRHLNQASSERVKGSGKDIDRFLTGIFDDAGLNVRKASVKSIKAGDLRHEITFTEDGETKTEVYPIVIYAPGIGEPLHPDDPKRMKTPHERNEVGLRWQQQRDKNGLARLGNMVVLVGLGNSTAEVVHQLQTTRHKAPDYRILTHHSVTRSTQRDYYDYGYSRGPELSSLYRNVGLPDLSRLAGDLSHIDRLVRTAYRDGKIIDGVRSWHHEGGVLTAKRTNRRATEIPFDKLFTLIGYGQNPKTNEAMSLQTSDERTGTIYYDFDGEVQ